MDFSSFKNYYFLHCFSQQKFRDEFNSGEKIYINSVQFFHNLENDFQQDFEGCVFMQKPEIKGYLLSTNSELTADEVIDKVINRRIEEQEYLMHTSDFKIYINGYLFCLTLIPKYSLEINNNRIEFSNCDVANWWYFLLNQYTKDCKYTFISLYDAQSFMEIFYPQMKNKGYTISYGCVAYKNISQLQKMQAYKQKDVEKLVFTKNHAFNYQKEFRLFIQKTDEEPKDHIEECGIDLRDSVINDFVYLSPEYVKELGIDIR